MIISECIGFVDQMNESQSYITLTLSSGETMDGIVSTDTLKCHGIRERRRFKYQIVERDGVIEALFEDIPDIEVSEDREREINEYINQMLGGEV